MGFWSDKRIKRLQRELDEVRLRLQASEERLAAERDVNSQMNACLDEALEVIAASDETLSKQHELIDTLKATLANYQTIMDSQVKPLAEEVLLLVGGRGEQKACVLDE
jgi:uncharacterized coiled-coil protein SlyX